MNGAELQSPTGGVPQFRAVLRPHRSLSGRGFLVLMCFIGGVSFVAGIAFLMIGAWPVLGFFGLDVAAIYYAFRLNYRDAAACEVIEIADHQLTVTAIDKRGRVRTSQFNTAWVRLDVTESASGAVDLRLRSRGNGLGIAGFLNPEQKLSFADSLSQALVAARGGPRI